MTSLSPKRAPAFPRYTPEWTNFNDADPGMTLVKLQAWLIETILYRLNKLPDLNYIKFLELLHIKPQPAVAAQAQLTFKLKKLNKPTDPLAVLIAEEHAGERSTIPDLAGEVIFETDRTLTALNGVLAAVIAPVRPEVLEGRRFRSNRPCSWSPNMTPTRRKSRPACRSLPLARSLSPTTVAC